MYVLIACEESQTVCKAFRELGHLAFSCDITPCSGGHPEWHIQGDVLDILDAGWDVMIAHPPCTHLANSGAKHFARKIADGRQQAALEFVSTLLNAPIPRIALENPVGVISSHIRKPDQIIHPWQFGHEAEKTTCLWLKGLPLLQPTNIVGKGEFMVTKSGRKLPMWYGKLPPPKDRARIRSKTFEGMARAMAEQWGGKGQ